uniref:Transmembrane protein n=1 Tax=Glossina pallidipes TaxID=7398 RepID=A0A1B0ADH3_GLOPL
MLTISLGQVSLKKRKRVDDKVGKNNIGRDRAYANFDCGRTSHAVHNRKNNVFLLLFLLLLVLSDLHGNIFYIRAYEGICVDNYVGPSLMGYVVYARICRNYFADTGNHLKSFQKS